MNTAASRLPPPSPKRPSPSAAAVMLSGLLGLLLVVSAGLMRWSPALAQEQPVLRTASAAAGSCVAAGAGLGAVSGAGIAAPASPVLDDAATAAMRWQHRTLDHDLWDYDLGAQPTLMDLEINGRMRRVLLQATKTGSVYMLDAATGVPLRAAEHRAAPAGRRRLEPAVTALARPPCSVTHAVWLPMTDPPCMAPPSAHRAAAGGRARQRARLDDSAVVFALPR